MQETAPTPATIRSAAEKTCRQHGFQVTVTAIAPLGSGFAITFDFPKAEGMSEARWKQSIKEITSLLQVIPGVSRVLVEIGPRRP